MLPTRPATAARALGRFGSGRTRGRAWRGPGGRSGGPSRTSQRRLTTAFATRSSSPGNTGSPGTSSKARRPPHRRAAAVRSFWEHLLRQHWRLCALAPLTRVAERDLLEADAVVAGRARDVQVAVNGDLGPEPGVPVSGPGGAAPLRERGEPQHVRRLADQWPGAGEDGLHGGAEGRQSAFGLLQPGVTPGPP